MAPIYRYIGNSNHDVCVIFKLRKICRTVGVLTLFKLHSIYDQTIELGEDISFCQIDNHKTRVEYNDFIVCRYWAVIYSIW